MIAITTPPATYNAVTFQPNRPNSSTIATSFTSGGAIRKLSVTPSGTPAADETDEHGNR